jgi:predicted HTH transcriptional regulator
VLAGMIREQNARIIHAELTSYKALDTLETSTIEQLFGTSTGVSQMSFIPKTTLGSNAKIPNSNDQKSKRQDDILSFINQRKSAVIKDISTLFPDVSEKTIQRELGALVDAGKITKRGSKRWSIYLAVSA